MIDGVPQALAVAGAIGAAVNAGVFFAFSTFVMRALRALPPENGQSAMQAINRAAPTPLFMTALFGTALVAVAAVVVAIVEASEPWAAHLLTGAALYLVCPVVTVVYHVPRNHALERADGGAAGAAQRWRRWQRAWTRWNHLRTVACLASAITFALALRAT